MKFILVALLIAMLPLTGISGEVKPEKETKIELINLTKAEFLEKIANYEKNPDSWNYLGDKPAIVDFTATWCPPCKILTPRLEQIAKEYEGKIYIYKVDIDKEKELASVFEITSVPTLLFIPTKGSPRVSKGLLSMDMLREQVIQTLLAK